MEMLSLSKNLSIREYDNNFIIYNKLFGNLSILSQSQYNILMKSDSPDDKTLFLKQEYKNRFFLIPQGFEERQIVDNEKKYRENNIETGFLVNGLQLVLTNDCNFKCSYCFSNELHNTVKTGSKSNSCGHKLLKMDKDTAFLAVDNIISVLHRNNNIYLTIEFFGGEPLLNWDIIEAVLDRYKNGEDERVKINYILTTNGSLINNKVSKKLKERNVHVVLSYDTPGNHYRLTNKMNSAEELIIRGLINLKKYNNSVSFNSVLSYINIDKFDSEALLLLAKEYGVNTIALILDLSNYPYDDDAVMNKIMDALLCTCRLAREYNISITGYWHQIFEQITDARPLNLRKGYKTCAAEGCKISVEPDGLISNCKCVDTKIGSIDYIDEVFKTEKYKKYASKAYETTPFCKDCDIEGFCSGLCMGTLDLKFNDVMALVPATCSLYKTITRKLLDDLFLTDYERFTIKI